MKQIGHIAAGAVNQIEQGKPRQELSKPSRPQALALRNDQPGRARIAEGIVLFFDTLKTYGKEPEQIENVTKMFLWVLADYPVEQILDAMAFYAKHYPDMPAPADIANIIERGNKPPLRESVYIQISKKLPDTRSSEEWAYMREYERFMLG